MVYYLVNRQYRRLEAEAHSKDSSAPELVAYYLGNWFSMSPGEAAFDLNPTHVVNPLVPRRMQPLS